MTEFVEQVSGIGSLAEPVRRELYLYVCSRAMATSRDEAADALGVPRHTAKFHLDKLASEGLLEVEFARLSGRTGPGAGRPSKLYRRSAREISVSLPGREYELAGQLMAEAITDSASTGASPLTALDQAAARRGHQMGASVLSESGPPTTHAKALELACQALAANGYEPRPAADRVELANCPFHALASTHTDMVCGMNLALINAMVEAVDAEGLMCRLDPGEGRCCVVLGTR